MSYFQGARKVVTVNFVTNPKYWAKVYADKKWSDTKQFMAVDGAGNIDIVTGADQYLANAILEWNLDLPDGSVAPITTENIDLLEKDDALALISATGAQVEDPDVKKNSPAK